MKTWSVKRRKDCNLHDADFEKGTPQYKRAFYLILCS
jgi:hypothetical protein